MAIVLLEELVQGRERSQNSNTDEKRRRGKKEKGFTPRKRKKKETEKKTETYHTHGHGNPGRKIAHTHVGAFRSVHTSSTTEGITAFEKPTSSLKRNIGHTRLHHGLAFLWDRDLNHPTIDTRIDTSVISILGQREGATEAAIAPLHTIELVRLLLILARALPADGDDIVVRHLYLDVFLAHSWSIQTQYMRILYENSHEMRRRDGRGERAGCLVSQGSPMRYKHTHTHTHTHTRT